MFRFEDPKYLYLLLLLALWAIIYILSCISRKRKLKRFGEMQLIKALMPDASSKRQHIKFLIALFAAAMLIVALARPQMGMTVDNEKKQGSEVVIALDISNSMLAEDVSPNRLECAKQLISSTIDRMDNDKVGIVVFAGDAFNMLPITSDNISANMFLDAINPSLITRQGTAIGDAINLTTKSFTSKENVGRAVIVITDGEDHEGGAEEAAKEAAKKGIRVFIIGVGKDSGAPVPDPADKNKYIVDKNGQTVISRLNKDMCRKIAEAGKGTFIYLTNAPTARERLFNDLDKIKKSEMSSAVYSSYAEQFQWVALIALIALIIDAIIMERKNHVLRKLNLFKKR